MAILNVFRNKRTDDRPVQASFGGLLGGYSIEVMPRTAAKIDSFRDFLPRGTRVYVAHIDGTPIEDMVATAKRRIRGHAAYSGAQHSRQGDAAGLDQPLSQ